MNIRRCCANQRVLFLFPYQYPTSLRIRKQAIAVCLLFIILSIDCFGTIGSRQLYTQSLQQKFTLRRTSPTIHHTTGSITRMKSNPTDSGSGNNNDEAETKTSTESLEPMTTTRDTIQRKTWNPFRLAILRLKMTEPAMTSALNYGKFQNNGTFNCAYCNHTLFGTEAKYNSGTGWPSFWRTATTESVSYHREWDGRLECKCAKCDSHLGHVFLDGPRPSSIDDQELVRSAPDTDPRSSTTSNSYLPRFCVNGLALTYQPPSM